MRATPVMALTIGFALGMAVPCVADRIYFKDGRELEAFIIRRNESQVVIRDGRTQIIVPAESVARIEAGSEADHRLLKGRDALGEGEVEAALEDLGEAIRGGADSAEAIRLLILHQERVSDAARRMSARGLEKLARLLDQLKETRYEREGEWLAAQARWRIQLGDGEETARLLRVMRETEPRALETRRIEIVEWLGSRTDEAIEEDDYSLALDLLLEIGRLDNREAGNRRLEMAMLWARRERDRGDYESALRVYADQLLPLSPKIALDRIAVTLAEAERHYRNVNQLGRAIDLYEKFGLVHDPERSAERLVDLWHEFGRGCLDRGEVAEARRIFQRSEQLVPESATRELALCDHAEMRAAIGANDFISHYKLGEWCVEKGLLDEARASFEAAGGSEVLREAVWEQIQRVNDRQAEEELKRLLGLYESGKYVDVIDGVMRFKTRAAAEGLHAQAAQLDRLARDAIAYSAAERPQQAEVLMQQAERFYWTGDVEKSDGLLQTLMAMYADTPAGARARQFYQTIKPRLDLDTLERKRGRTAAENPSAKPDGGGEESALAEEIRRLRMAMREGDVETGGKKVNNDDAGEKAPGSPSPDSPAVDLSVITGRP